MARVERTMAKTLKPGALRVLATCPHCLYNLVPVTDEPQSGRNGEDQRAYYDHGHDRGRGGYRVICDSCGEPFVLEQDAVNNVQYAALVMQGEA